MRFLHCSDIHLGRKPVGAALGEFSRKRFEDYFKAFSFIVDTAIERQVDALVIAGDFFDKKELSPDVLSRTENMLQKLNAAYIPVILIEGNHDNVSSGSEHDSWIVYLEQKGLIARPNYKFENGAYIFNKISHGDVDFYGLGYPGSMVDETISALAEHLKNHTERKNVVLVHTAIGSDEFMPGLCSEEALDTLKGLAIYVAAGHFHHFSKYPYNNPYFFIPGSPEFWDFGEAGQTKGMIIFDTDTKSYEFISANPRNTIRLVFDIDSENYPQFKEEFSEKLNDVVIEAGEDVVVAVLKLKKGFFIDTAWCEELLKEKGSLKSFIKIVYPKQTFFDSLTEEIKGVEQIERELIEGWRYFSTFTSETAKTLTSLKAFQKESKKDDFFEHFDTLLNKVLSKEAEHENQ